MKEKNDENEESAYIVKEKIIIDVQTAFVENKSLGVDELIKKSGHTMATIMKYFGSVDSLLKMAKINLNNRFNNDYLIEDFKNIYLELGRFPTAKDLREKAKYHFSTFMRRFGSIEAVAEAAGIKREESQLNISEEELLNELRKAYADLGRIPMIEDINYKRKYCVNSYVRVFGSFSNALQKIGLLPIKQNKVNQICPICGISSVSMISHFSNNHPDELKKQEQMVIELFKSGVSSRNIAAREDIIFNGGTSVNRVIRKYLSKEEIEELRVSKIKNKLKKDYSDGKYEWVNELNRNRNVLPESKEKNSNGLKKAYASGVRKSWNGGLTKETDERVAKCSESISESLKGGFESGEIDKKIGPEASNWNENRDEVARRYRLNLDFSSEQRKLIKIRAKNKCEICGITQEELIKNGETLQCDHIIPIYKGGINDWENNGRALCPKCHHNKTASDCVNKEIL